MIRRMVLTLTLEQTRTRKVASLTCSQPMPPASGHMSNQRSPLPYRWGENSSAAAPLDSCRRHDLLQGGARRGGAGGVTV